MIELSRDWCEAAARRAAEWGDLECTVGPPWREEMPTVRGWGPWRRTWVSFQSNPALTGVAHGYGHWTWAWGRAASGWVYDRWPVAWRWWVNLPGVRWWWLRPLRRHFPNLR